MKNFFYLLQKPKIFNLSIKNKDHVLYFNDNQVFIRPRKPISSYVNPRSLYKLKQKFKIKQITIFDRLKNTNKEVCISNHVNRSGKNFLIGNTPFKSFPRFPDITKIYNNISGLEQVVVHTVGPSRFRSFSEKNIIISESVGLVAPVWHYVGTKIFARSYKDEKN